MRNIKLHIRILLAIALLFSMLSISYGQTPQPTATSTNMTSKYYKYLGYVGVDSGLFIPSRDTTFIPLNKASAITRKPSNQKIYYYDSLKNKWTILGSGSFDTAANYTVTGNWNFLNDVYINALTVGRGGSIGGSGANNIYNVALGYNALVGNRYSATHNTALGAQSLNSNSTGQNNTAVGNNALFNNNDGSNNVAIGYKASESNVSNANTTSIGVQSSASGNNSSALGYLSTTSTDNQIQLGNTSVTNVNTSGTYTAGAVTYPNAHGTNGQVLSTTGSGTLVWANNGSGGTITGNYPTITSSKVPITYWNGTNRISYTNGLVVDSLTSNLFVNNIIGRSLTIASSSTPINITASSVPNYVINGSTNQVVNMANATTLPKGAMFTFNNNGSTGVDSIRNSSGTLIVAVPNGGYATLTLNDSTTSAGTWDWHFSAPSSVQWSTNTFNLGNASITNATWNASVIGSNKGGAGAVTGILKADGSGNVSAATSNAPITITSGVIGVDTTTRFTGLATIGKAYNDSLVLATATNARVKYTDTASMLTPYLRSNVAAATYQPILTAGSNITITSNTIAADTSTGSTKLATQGYVTRNSTSGGGLTGSGTVSSSVVPLATWSSTNTRLSSTLTKATYDTTTGKFTFTPSVAVSSNAATGIYMNPTLTSSNVSVQQDAMVGLDIAPTFTTSAVQFTYPLRAGGVPFGGGYGSLSDNIAIGNKALMTNISGVRNIGIGTQTMFNQTSGTDNVAIGYQSIFSANSASSICIGSNTVGGTGIVAIGYQANKNGSGNYGIGIGYQALSQVAGNSGSDNIAIGRSALDNGQGGSLVSNIAIGYLAGHSINNGANYNIAIGQSSMTNPSFANNSQYNIGIGAYSLYGIKGGSYNTVIGGNSSGTALGIQTGNYNTILGFGISGLSDVSNNIILSDGQGNIKYRWDGTTNNIYGNLTLPTAGNKLNIATGTNASVGTATLASGTVTVSTTAVTASSIILLTLQGCSNCGTLYISAKTAGTSFVISSTNVLDGSVVAYQIIN
jgi:hypothetical protein